MDMWDPFILAVRNCVPDADEKICFDRFHVAQHFGEALDKVRLQEHRMLLAAEREWCEFCGRVFGVKSILR